MKPRPTTAQGSGAKRGAAARRAGTPKKTATARGRNQNAGGRAPTRSPVETRHIAPLVRMILAVRAGGICELPGCERYLFEHHLTLSEGNFAEVAHVVGFKKRGPRGGGKRPARINAIDNLMLLCASCHKHVDDHPGEFPVSVLKKYKAAHEKRIRELTATHPELRTVIVQLKGLIGGQSVDIPARDVRAAIAPRYAADRYGCVIDLTGIGADTPAFYELGQKKIEADVAKLLGGFDPHEERHFSVFALAAIPLLVCFGRALGDKVAVDLFQRHRDESWRWRDGGASAVYEQIVVRDVPDASDVAIVLSLSGQITESSWPAQIDDRCAVYELRSVSEAPNRAFLKTRDDLEAFRRAYAALLAIVVQRHPTVRSAMLLPAVPAPVAIACGRDLLPKVHPELRVYDNVNGGFRYCLTVNAPLA